VRRIEQWLTSASTNAAGTGQYSDTYAYDAIGNITNNDGNAYTYDSSQPHAVTAAFGNAYSYDANGNQTGRIIGGVAYTFTFDYENRLTEVKQGTTTVATFVYDAEGNRVKGTVNGTTVAYIDGVYEYHDGAEIRYYEGGVFLRGGFASDTGRFYLLRDHPGSSSVIVSHNGAAVKREYYYPYGGNRGATFSDWTTKRFTGQYHESGLPGGEGLSYYNARWYDAQLGRFVSADTIVPDPGDPQALNRLAYALNNPLRFVDPTGHTPGGPYFDSESGGGKPYQSPLNSRQLGLIKKYSATYGVPWQVTAGLLSVEILDDTGIVDHVENFVSVVCGFCNVHIRKFPGADRFLSVDPGPGVGNIHISSARAVSNYFAENYSEMNDLQLGFDTLNDSRLTSRLARDELNIKTVAAYIRLLADYRFGSGGEPLMVDHSGLSGWTLADATAVWHAYRYGVPRVPAPGDRGFERIESYQNRNLSVGEALNQGIYRGTDAIRSVMVSLPGFQYYLNQR